MTAIDTSKLKEGMRVEYKINGVIKTGFLSCGTHFWVDRIYGHGIVHNDGRLFSDITDLVFPDLQEQDRVEAWKPGDNALGFEDMQLTIIAIHGNEAWCKYSNCGIDKVHSLSMLKPIPKPDPDGELRELILEACAYCLGYGQSSPSLEQSKVKTVVNSALEKFDTISQIKSLLAAKVPSREEFEKRFDQVWRLNTSVPINAAWLTFLHFTKNETK